MTGIYLIKNKVNGKCYVGQAMDIEKRLKRHIRDSKKKVKQTIHRAIAKYGIENFEFSILELCSADELDAREIFWIDQLDTFNNGYNLTLGGGGSNLGKNCYSSEYKRAASKKRYDKVKDDPEFKEKDKASSLAYYKSNKDDPEFKMKNRANKKAFYKAHKDDPEFKEKHRASSLAYYKAHKDDPEFKEKECARKKAYYESHKSNPSSQDHTDMPLW